MKNRVSRRVRAAVTGVIALFSALAVPQLAQAAPSAHASTARASTARAGTAWSVTPSGTDASCPAASSAAAASATVSAPAEARAISGSGSATVPDDWAIIDGLSNGTSYTFTVTANTKSGASSAAASTNAVTPTPIPEPKNLIKGAPRTVRYDQYSMLIGGKRVYVTAGEFDPWRTPSPSLWLDDLQKMKADDYDAVTTYFDWDYNSPPPACTTSPACGTTTSS